LTDSDLSGFLWLLVCLLPFLVAQRLLHREAQLIFLGLTRREDLAVGLFSLLFLPGVLLHEFSHWLMARLLKVRTGRFSLLPKSMPGGKLRLGFVETEETDLFRDALIGTAPLITGGAVVAFLGLFPLGIRNLSINFDTLNIGQFLRDMQQLPTQDDFWVWFYFAFVISSTMLPSASDRRSWLPIITGSLLLLGIVLLAGGGDWMLNNIAPVVNEVMFALVLVFGTSLAMHVVLLLPLWLVRLILFRLRGLRVAYSG
jgi:hypothetical protein